MARSCSVCIHDQRPAIDRELLDGSASLRDIAGRYDLSRTALGRHRKSHLSQRMAEVAERDAEADVRTAIDVRKQLRAINGIALSILKEARSAGDGQLALQAIDRIQKQIELQAKLIDLINDGDTVNVMISPAWVEMRTVILTALQDHPEARQRVAAAVQGMSQEE